jgi:hypothetical protein
MVRAVCPLFMFAYYVLTGQGAAESFSCLAPCNARSALLLIRLVAPVIQLRRGFFFAGRVACSDSLLVAIVFYFRIIDRNQNVNLSLEQDIATSVVLEIKMVHEGKSRTKMTIYHMYSLSEGGCKYSSLIFRYSFVPRESWPSNI